MSDSTAGLKVAPRDPDDLHARVSVLEQRADNMEEACKETQGIADKAMSGLTKVENRMAYVFGVGAGIGAASAIILWLLDKLLNK